MIIYIDRQHAGKPKKIQDRGASSDLNQDGRIGNDELEAIWTARIGIELEILLLDMGYNVIPISDGSYSDRHKRVNLYSNIAPSIKQVYLAMHLNAGGGDYGSFFHYFGSEEGKSLAENMSEALQAECEELSKVKAIPAKPDDWTKNAYNTIKGIGRPVAICCEPIFMDSHAKMLSINGIKKIAWGMATGIKKWDLK